MSLASRRLEYETAGLHEGDLLPDPLAQWELWFEQASSAGCVEPNAFVLGTVDAEGFPQTRYLLARGADERGFAFFTNHESDKGHQLAAHPQASMLFTWLQLHRQVRVSVLVERLPDDESDAYFATRPRPSQIGAWASRQSRVLGGREELDARVEEMERTFAHLDAVPRPEFWGGWLARPVTWEFWQGRASRLHDRLRYRRSGPDAAWVVERLSP